jgi:hypothetical protein
MEREIVFKERERQRLLLSK